MPDIESVIDIAEDGELKFIYDDRLSGLLADATEETRIERASHIEPDVVDGRVQWFANLSPVNGPMLGPFVTRQDALTAEIFWLQQNYL